MAENTNKLSKHVALLRISFGVIWMINALLKWQPTFRNTFFDHIKSVSEGQPGWLSSWFHFWTNLIGHNPHLYAVMTALLESLIALALIFGIARRFTYISAVIFSLLIWSVAEGFGGPYTSSSTNIDAGIIYAVVFLALYGLDRLSIKAKWSLDNYISKKISWWSVISNP